MQEFIVTIKVTANTLGPVSEAEITAELNQVLEEGYDCGTAEVLEAREV